MSRHAWKQISHDRSRTLGVVVCRRLEHDLQRLTVQQLLAFVSEDLVDLWLL